MKKAEIILKTVGLSWPTATSALAIKETCSVEMQKATMKKHQTI